MRDLRSVLFFVILMVCWDISFSQLNTTCSNSNFITGTFDSWLGYWGTFANPTKYPELDTNTVPPYPHNNEQCYQAPPYNITRCPPLHSLIPAPGSPDPNTGDSLLSVFPGEPYSARLGHPRGGAHGSVLKYNIYVSDSTYLFVYRYAVVLQNPPHTPAQQPSFTVAVTNPSGTIFDSACGYYYIYAHVNPLPPTWHIHNQSGGMVIWKEWTTVGMSLANYVGQNVSIVFTARDCSPGGHFGYAYISAYCNFLQVHTAMCEGDTSATLTAPPGFSYLWSTGDTTASIVVPQPITGSAYNCTLTALNGCQVTIFDTLTYTVIHTNFTYSGSGCYTLPIQFQDSSYVSQNEVVGWKWNFGDGTPEVTGIPNPSHIFPGSGTFNVKLISYSSEGCADSVTKQITTHPLPVLTNDPLNKTICSRSNTNITLTGSEPGTLFTWTASAKTPFTTGFSSNTTNPTTLISQVLVNTGNSTDTVTYHATPHDGNCTGPPSDFRVAVKPLPQLLTAPLSKSICNNTSTNIHLSSNLDSTAFTWVCTPSSGNVSGYASNLLTPDTLINQVLQNSGTGFETVTYAIVPQRNGCFGDTSDFIVTVKPVPDVYFNPSAQTICSQQVTGIQNLSHVPGASFSWTASGSSPNVSGFSSGSGSLIQQTISNTGYFVETVTYTVSPSIGGCPGIPGTVNVTVNYVPVVSLPQCWDIITLTDAKPFRLKGGVPNGGTYSGTGVTGNIFTPSSTGPGTFVIAYSYTNVLGCTRSAGRNINVIPPTPFSCGNDWTDIRDNKKYPTVKIGMQCWMAANLNYGTTIPGSQVQSDNCIMEKYCYNNNPVNCAGYGGLYQWDELMCYAIEEGSQGLCPPAWHIPRETEWNTLFANFVGNGFAGSALKYDGYSGFIAFLSGVMFGNVNWNFSNFAVFYWSSTSHGAYKAWAHGMNSFVPSVSYYPSSRSNAFPVRCIKD